MEKNSNKDQLEQFLRSHLEDYDAAESAWSMPPADSLDQALGKMQAKPKKKSKIWILLVVLGLLMISGIAYQFSRYDKKLDGLSSQLESTKESLDEVQHKVDELETQQENSDKTTNKQLPASVTPILKFPLAIQPLGAPISSVNLESLNENTLESLMNTQDSEIIPLNKPDKHQLSPAVQPSIFDFDKEIFQEDPLAIPETAISRELFFIPQISNIVLPGLDIQNTVLNIEPLAFSKKKTRNRFFLKLMGGPVAINQITKNGPENLGALVQHSFNGKTIALAAEWQLSRKWQLETGLQYFKYTAQSLHNRQFNYSTGSEHLPTLGPYDSEVKLALNSPLGLINTSIVFTRDPSSIIPEEALIDLEIGTKTELQYLNIPLTLNYQALTKGRLGLSFRGGIIGSVLMDQQFKLAKADASNSLLLFTMGEASSDIKGLQKFTLNYLIGAGVEYQLSSKFTLRIEPTYTESISPIITNGNNFQIRMQAFGLYGGFRFRF